MIEDEPAPLYQRDLGNGSEVTVWPMLGGKARVCLGPIGGLGYEDGYCYARPRQAIAAAMVWSGEGDPLDGWHRHPFSGRRREGGDPTKEVVRW
jgi:hypothetical protein